MRRNIYALLLVESVALAACTSAGSQPTATFNGSGCSYEGPTEFDLNEEVTFRFVNESEVSSDRLGLGVVPIPDGTTAGRPARRF